MTAHGPVESRWPAALCVLLTLALLVALPDRLRLMPVWVLLLSVALPLVAMCAARVLPTHRGMLELERGVMLAFGVFGTLGVLVMIASLVLEMTSKSAGISGLWLLSSSIVVWILNVVSFTMLYWQLDRGGIAGRAEGQPVHPDWQFAQQSAGDAVSSDWRPVFVDYLFLGFTTATAFSPTDTLPLTSRAKLLMLAESLISLMTTLVAVSRAINTLA